MGVFEKHLIAINIIGFLIYFINLLLYRFTESAGVDKLLTTITFLYRDISKGRKSCTRDFRPLLS